MDTYPCKYCSVKCPQTHYLLVSDFPTFEIVKIPILNSEIGFVYTEAKRQTLFSSSKNTYLVAKKIKKENNFHEIA